MKPPEPLPWHWRAAELAVPYPKFFPALESGPRALVMASVESTKKLLAMIICECDPATPQCIISKSKD